MKLSISKFLLVFIAQVFVVCIFEKELRCSSAFQIHSNTSQSRILNSFTFMVKGGFGESGSVRSKKKKGKSKKKRPIQRKAISSISPALVQKLDDDARSVLAECNNDIDKARTSFLGYHLAYLETSMPALYKSIKDGEHMSNKETHEALVELSWDSVAAFMPLTHSNGPTLDASKRLKAVAQSAVFRGPNENDLPLRLLDVGCGNGLILPFCEKVAPSMSYVGCDVSSRMIELAEKECIVSSNTVFINDSFENVVSGKTKVGKKSYDGIIFNGSIQFFPDITQTLRTAVNNLSEEGQIVLSHISGGAFVAKEMLDNPATVRSLMPNISDLKAIAERLDLNVILPSFANVESKGGIEAVDKKLQEFYLVVLKKGGKAVQNGDTISEYFDFPEIKL